MSPRPLPPSRPSSYAIPSALGEYDDGHLPPEVRRALHDGRLRREFYVYALRSDRAGGPGNIGSGATRPDLLTISPDADFEILQLASDTRTNLDVMLQIGGGGSNRDVFSDRAAVASVFGTGAQPYWLPTPIFVPRTISITATVTETGSGSRAYNFDFIGARFVPGR